MSTLTGAGGLEHGIGHVVVYCKTFIGHEYIHLVPVNSGHSGVNERSCVSTHAGSDGNTIHHIAVVVVHVAGGRGRRIHHPAISFGTSSVLVVHVLVGSVRRSSLSHSITTRCQQDGQQQRHRDQSRNSKSFHGFFPPTVSCNL